MTTGQLEKYLHGRKLITMTIDLFCVSKIQNLEQATVQFSELGPDEKPLNKILISISFKDAKQAEQFIYNKIYHFDITQL